MPNWGQIPIEMQQAQQIQDLLRRIDELEQRTLRIPFVNQDPTDKTINIWAFPDGRFKIRMPDGVTIREYRPYDGGTTPSPTPTASTVLLPPNVQPQTYLFDSEAAWTQSYYGQLGEQRSTPHLYYGSEPLMGQQRSMIGWDGLDVLVGSRIASVELFLTNVETYLSSGVDIRFGAHLQSSKPANYVSGAIVTSAHFTEQDGRWISLPVRMGELLRDGYRGFILEQPDSNNTNFGFAAGLGDPNGPPPRLRITYVK